MKLEELLKEADARRPEHQPMFTVALTSCEGVRIYLNILLKDQKFTLTEEVIKHLHTLLYQDQDPGNAGKYREESEELDRYLQHYLGQLEISEHLYHPIEFAAIAHKRFMDVKPFAQGNEAIALLLLNLWLLRGGYAPVLINETNEQRYQEALKEARNPACPDPDALIRFVAQTVIDAEIGDSQG